MDADKRVKLIKLLGMLGSAHDGEVLNAAKLAQRTLGECGITWEELLSSGGGGVKSYLDGYQEGFATGLAKGKRDAARPARAMTWTALAKDLMLNYVDDLNDWEQGFVESYVERGWDSPTDKQRGVFERMCAKCGLAMPDY